MDSNSRQIEEDEDHNNNLNRNSHYSALICPVTRTNFSGIIMNYKMSVQLLKIILIVEYAILYFKEISKKINCQHQIVIIIFLNI